MGSFQVTFQAGSRWAARALGAGREAGAPTGPSGWRAGDRHPTHGEVREVGEEVRGSLCEETSDRPSSFVGTARPCDA